MPITPRFTLSQTPSTVVVTIRVPHVRVSASTVEVLVDGQEFHFHSPPYLLHLSFPSNLVDDAETGREARAVFDPSKDDGTLTVTVHKEEEGAWEDLDLLGKLMQKRSGAVNASGAVGGSKISVLSATDNVDGVEESGPGNGSAADAGSDSQNMNDGHVDLSSALKPHYGFLSSFHSIFAAYGRDGLTEDCIELPDPDSTAPCERRALRLEMEGDKFDEDRYLGDVFLGELEDEDDDGGDMIYEEAVHMVPIWQQYNSVDEVTAAVGRLSTDENARCAEQAGSTNTDDSFFSSEETHLLATISTAILPTKHPIDATRCESLLLGLTDILFGYAYDHRTTSGDPTVESQWTCSILSPTLSWFEEYDAPYDSLADVLRWCIRRSLIYPYIRSYSFARLIAMDVAAILSSGRRMVLRCLLQLRQILHKSEGRYLLCKIYLDPYIVWVQSGLEDETLQSFAARVMAMAKQENGRGVDILGKASLGLGLVELEKAAIYGDEEGGESDRSQEDESSDDESSSDSSDDPDAHAENEASGGGSYDCEETSSSSRPSEAQTSPKRSSALIDENIGGTCLANIPISELPDGAVHGDGEVRHDESQQAKKKPLIEEL